MKRVVQFETATGIVRAVVRPSGALVVPAGMTFMEIEDDEPSPDCKRWTGEAFEEIAEE